jgi:hypothetical protein
MDEREAARRVAIAYFVFERGGIAGAVRRLVFGWRGRFSAVQIEIALRRRWPLLVPNKHQVADCIDRLERLRVIECIAQRHSKIYQRREYENRETPLLRTELVADRAHWGDLLHARS